MATSTPPAPAPSSEMLDALRVLQAQNRQLRRLQEVSYQWQLQHHANLKKIMAGLNRLSEVLQERTGAKAVDLQMEENSALFQPFAQEGLPPTTDAAGANLHEYIMTFRDNPMAAGLQSALMQLTAEQFETLREQSAEIAFAVMASWISGADLTLQCLAAVFLLEAAKKFPSIFANPQHKVLVRRCAEGLNRVWKTNPDALSPEEFSQLKSFFLSVADTA